MFQFFGEMAGALTKPFVATTRLMEIGQEINRIANSEQCELVVVPWQKDAPGYVALIQGQTKI